MDEELTKQAQSAHSQSARVAQDDRPLPSGSSSLDRRGFLRRAALGAAAVASVPIVGSLAPASVSACGGGSPMEPALAAPVCARTEANIEGPFFRPGAPHRTSLVGPATSGVPLLLSGRVLSGACRAVGRARLEFWQADHRGAYDLEGFQFRARVLAGHDGSWSLRTILPGRYLNGSQYRPSHVHVKVHVPGRPTLTTQLYFAGDPYLESDPWARRSLVLQLSDVPGGGKLGTFDFVV
ncbi:MAG: dioxygenase [Deltaproteobacteria bacterium]|nr:dioxygenase [Deltaproteobacteria bacterium]